MVHLLVLHVLVFRTIVPVWVSYTCWYFLCGLWRLCHDRRMHIHNILWSILNIITTDTKPSNLYERGRLQTGGGKTKLHWGLMPHVGEPPFAFVVETEGVVESVS